MLPANLKAHLYKVEQKFIGNSEVFSRLEFLNESQYYDPQQLHELQWNKLKKLLAYSYKTVPYYQILFNENGIHPDDIVSYNDFLKVPLLSRKQIAENRDALISDAYTRSELKSASSSGSTGQPLTLYHTKDFRLWSKAHQLRNYNWCGGYTIGDKFALLWGSELYFKFKTYLDIIENYLQNRIEFNTFRLNETNMLKICRTLERFKPTLISSYPSSLLFMSEIMEKYNIVITPSAIQTTSETLTENDRSLISKKFNCKVLDKYGSRETNVIASECECQTGMHINCENTFVEFIRDNKPVKPGELGEIVVTNLNNYGMPLIRYSIGDLGVQAAEQCTCGRTLPLMQKLSGRESDIISTSKGDMIDSYFFSYLFQNFGEIAYFQVIQDTIDELVIHIVLNTSVEKDSFEKKIIEKINLITGNSFSILFRYVDTIPVEASGKRRLTISKVPFTWGNRVSHP